jgi:hypothetical protein
MSRTTAGKGGEIGKGSKPPRAAGKEGTAPITGGVPNDETGQEIHAKHFGHVKKTTMALHKSDPGWGQHKR